LLHKLNEGCRLVQKFIAGNHSNRSLSTALESERRKKLKWHSNASVSA